MKIKLLCALATGLAALSLTSVGAQTLPTKYHIHFQGTCWTTNDNGQIVPQTINNRALLNDVASADGTAVSPSWGLAYHVGGSDLGDTIEIIDRNNGQTLRVLFGLYFGEDFGRMAILSKSKRQLKRLEYVYTDENSHSLGSALLTDYFSLSDTGATNKMSVVGKMQYIVTPDARHPKTQVCTAHFTTGTPWQFSSSP